MSRPKIFILFALILSLFLAVLQGYRTYTTSVQEYSISVTLDIEPGMSASQIIAILKDRNLIRFPLLFKTIVRFKGIGRKLKAGEYEFNSSMSPKEIIEVLEKGKVKVYSVTIPEGLSFFETGALLAGKGLVNYEEFIALGTSPKLLEIYNIIGETVEGYLFPDTYFFNKGMTTTQIIEILLDRFIDVYQSQFLPIAAQGELSRRQVITLASIVEREAQEDSERPIIARVFLNRLERSIPLESCATIIYALGYHANPLTHEDLQVTSPFNTYKHRGLPPGPICNPGAKSIAAVLNPSEGEYLYFVANEDGSHVFSRTLREHNRAKKKIRQGKK